MDHTCSSSSSSNSSSAQQNRRIDTKQGLSYADSASSGRARIKCQGEAPMRETDSADESGTSLHGGGSAVSDSNGAAKQHDVTQNSQ